LAPTAPEQIENAEKVEEEETQEIDDVSSNLIGPVTLFLSFFSAVAGPPWFRERLVRRQATTVN